MTTLTPELRQAVREAGNQPVPIIDPETNRRYVLVPADVFERLNLLVEHEPLSKEEQRWLLREAGKRAGWDDPEMDVYAGSSVDEGGQDLDVESRDRRLESLRRRTEHFRVGPKPTRDETQER
jgi:hypothetical protein